MVTVEALTAGEVAVDPSVLAELFRFQHLLTPAFDRRSGEHEFFEHDWPAYVSALGTEPAEVPLLETSLVHRPPSYVLRANDWDAFLVAHLAAVRSKVDLGTVTRVDIS